MILTIPTPVLEAVDDMCSWAINDCPIQTEKNAPTAVHGLATLQPKTLAVPSIPAQSPEALSSSKYSFTSLTGLNPNFSQLSSSNEAKE